MKRIVVGLVCCGAVFLNGCKSSGYKEAVEIMEDVLQCYNDAQEAYTSVKDAASAKGAAAKINEICDRLERLRQRADAVRIRESEDKELEKKYLPKLREKLAEVSSVASQARAKSQGEPSFKEADRRLVIIGGPVEAIPAP